MRKIVKFTTYEKAEGKPEYLGGLGGFFNDGMRWGDYLERFVGSVHEDLEQLRAGIIANEIKCTGQAHQDVDEAVALWDDGSVSTYSYRGWGDLMAAIWSTEEDKDYNYMAFYM